MTPPKPTEGELAILRVIWERGPSTVRDIHEVLGRTRYTTVAEAAADHDRERPGPSRTTGPHAFLPRMPHRVADAAAAGEGSAGPRVRWLGRAARHAGPGDQARDTLGARRDSETHRSLAQGSRMAGRQRLFCSTAGGSRALGWGMLHALWQGALIAAAAALLLARMRGNDSSSRYAVALRRAHGRAGGVRPHHLANAGGPIGVPGVSVERLRIPGAMGRLRVDCRREWRIREARRGLAAAAAPPRERGAGAAAMAGTSSMRSRSLSASAAAYV